MDESIVKKSQKITANHVFAKHCISMVAYLGVKFSFLLILMFPLSTALGQAEMPWQYRAKTKLKPGEKVSFLFVPKKDLRAVSIRVVDVHGKPVTAWQGKLIDAGEEKALEWPMQERRSKWRVHVEVGELDGISTATVDLETLVVEPLDISLTKNDIDFARGQVVVRTNRPLSRVSIRFVTANRPETQKVDVIPPQKIGRIVIKLPNIGDDRFKLIRFKFHDDAQQFFTADLVNWYARIPHDDVVFPSGSAEIPEAEKQKLLTVIKTIKREQRAFAEAVGNSQAVLDLKLYIAGMTDTVGSKRDNLRLSAERAKAIADAFRQHDVTCPIFSAGFGESRLKIGTADNVSEARNRRAVYVLTNHPPASLIPPGGRWTVSQ